jgi:hypothetical protein
MVALLIFLMLTCGLVASLCFLEYSGLIERLGFTIFFSLTVVPFININLAFLEGIYIDERLTILISFTCTVLLLIRLFLKKEKNCFRGTALVSLPRKKALFFLILAAILVFSYFYYSNKEFILSLGSYLIKGDAKCFYMQTFKTVASLNPELNKAELMHKTYEIICTPGNILFTSTFLPLFKLYSFKVVYLLFTALLFIFVYLVVRKLLANELIALLSAAFAVLNPYMLSVEVLDRNMMSLTLSAVLLYLILQHRKKVFLHGMVFGILAGTGLRFMPVVFIIPILMLYYPDFKDIKKYWVFIPAFIITFTFNIAHLYFNGFNSLGETSPSLVLIVEAFSHWRRTPFLPFPNALFYPINLLNYFGYLACGVIMCGAFNLWKESKKIFFSLFTMFFLVLFVLSYQRNWLEADKCRIIMEGFLPLYIFFAYGLKSLFFDKFHPRRYAVFFIFLILTVIFARMLSVIDFKEDAGFYQRKYLYQREDRLYYNLIRSNLSAIKIFPNYARLQDKAFLLRKHREERVIFENLFTQGALPNFDKFKGFYAQWKRYFIESPQELPAAKSADYVYLKIDFDKLVTAQAAAVEELDYVAIPAIDLESGSLFDNYYAGLSVSWQKEKLPVSIMLREDEVKYLKELNIDLNAFASFGKDKFGFNIINSINFISPSLIKAAYQTGARACPLSTENNAIILRLPEDCRIIIKNWFINEQGSPYKVDGWLIRRKGGNRYKAEFFYNEPESYL